MGGLTWWQGGTIAAVLTMIGGLIGTYIKGWPDRKRAAIENETSLRAELRELRARMDAQQADFTAKMQQLRDHYEERLSRMGEMLSSVSSDLETLLVMYEIAPEKAAETAAKIRDRQAHRGGKL